MSLILKLRNLFKGIAELVERVSPSQFPHGLPVLCYTGLDNNMPQDHTLPGKSLSELLGPVLYAVPRNRRTVERRLTRKHHIPQFAHAIPKKNIVICLNCGNPHEIQTICGHCYDQVRAETKKLRESMNQDEYRYNHPQKEVSYVYKDDDKYHPSYKGRYLVEIEENRPSWFPNVLTKKHKGEKD